MIGFNRAFAVTVLTAVLVVVVFGGENVVRLTRDCDAADKSCATAPKLVTAKNATNKTAAAANATTVGVVHRYDVMSGNDSNGSALKEIVLIDQVTPRTEVVSVAVKRTNNVTSFGANGSAVVKSVTDAIDKSMAAETILKRVDNATNASTNTTVVTTTAATTTVSINSEKSNVVSDANQVHLHFIRNKYCYCDLIDGSCDTNCCCDVDCTNHDLKSFTLCFDQVTTTAVKPESILFDSSLFYVVIDNVPSDYFYPERDSIESESQVAASLRNRDAFTWHDEKTNGDKHHLQTNLAHSSYDLTYKSLRWMYFHVSNVNSSEIKAFSLRSSSFNSLCDVERPVEYLTEMETDCRIYVSNLTDSCTDDSPLSFERYYGEKGLFKAVQPIVDVHHKTEKIGLIKIQAVRHHHCVSTNGTSYDCRVRSASGAFDDKRPYPVYSDGVCRQAVDTVEYRFTHNGTQGVRRVDVHFHHRDVTDAGRPVYVRHRYAARFVRISAIVHDGATAAVDVYRRSGKPGYTVGSPVLRTSVTALGAKDAAKRHRPLPMYLPLPDVHGMCSDNERLFVNVTGRRLSVNFLENVDVRCRIQIRRPRQLFKRADEGLIAGTTMTELCQGIQNETVSALGDYDGVLVASLGDPDVAKWIPVVVIKPSLQPSASLPQPDVTLCTAIINRMHVRVLYSHVGPFDSPQTTILGVLVNYTASSESVTIGYNNKHHGDNASLRFVIAEIPIRASVVFVDLTRPPIRTFAEPPTYEFRLPEDFYYPFWSSDDGRPVAIAASSCGLHFKFKLLIPLLLITSCFSPLSRV